MDNYEYEYLSFDVGNIKSELENISHELSKELEYGKIIILEDRLKTLTNRLSMLRSYIEVEQSLLEMEENL
jgi:hypothetical protein